MSDSFEPDIDPQSCASTEIERLTARLQERDEEIEHLTSHIVALTARTLQLEAKNTFWACKNHAGNNTLRCAICDEKRIAELEATFRHYHVKARDGVESPDDLCLKCGFDLRNPIHVKI